MKNINKLLLSFLLVSIVGFQSKSAFSQTTDTENNLRENQEKCIHHENHEMMGNNHPMNGNHEMMMGENGEKCKNHDMMGNNHPMNENHENHENHHNNQQQQPKN